jgi:preprotein translocase SecE subunit
MAVAVKSTPSAVTERELNRFAVASGLGVAYAIVALAVVFYGISALAAALSPSLTSAGLTGAVQTSLWLVVRLAALAGFVYVGINLVGAQAPRGLAAGIVVGVAALILIGLVTCWVGRALESAFGDRSPAAIALTAVLGIGLLGGMMYLYFQPRFEQRMIQLQDQGWFTIAPYKKSQGQKVRRGTILGLLILLGCGIWTLTQGNTLAGDVRVVLPFTSGAQAAPSSPGNNNDGIVSVSPDNNRLALTILPSARFSVPLLLAFGAFWLSYRVVNYPAFADFLIATEAELNKVSWTTRKRLIQDTIVVLVTVVLLTVFLFLVDQIWAWILTQIGIIQPPPATGGEGGSKVPY